MFVKNFFQPKIICLMLLYSIVSFSGWPFVVWIVALFIIGFAELILSVKDHLSSTSSYRNAPVVYVEKKDINKHDEIDWSKFDISKYPKVNFRKVFWEHKPLVNRGMEYTYPVADIIIGIYIAICAILSFVEWKLGNYILMRICLLSFVLLIIYFFYIPYGGKKFYEIDCKEEYAYYYKQQQV